MHVQIRMRLNNDILFLTFISIFFIDVGELQKQIELNGGLWFVSIEKQHGEIKVAKLPKFGRRFVLKVKCAINSFICIFQMQTFNNVPASQ